MVKDHSDSERGNPLPSNGQSFRLTARVLLYAPSHRQDNIYHGLCYTSHGALAGTRNSSMEAVTLHSTGFRHVVDAPGQSSVVELWRPTLP